MNMRAIILLISVFIILENSIAQKNICTESINTFAFRLLEQLQNNKENCFYSPFSVFDALSMTYSGSKENTKMEFEKVLDIQSGGNIHQNLLELSNDLGLERDFTFLSSNSLWLQKSLKPEKNFIKNAEEEYKAKIENVDFSGEHDREKARTQINEWVEKQTKGNLLNFIPKGILDESTIMLIVNAVYYNAGWLTEFDSDKITSDFFKVSSNDSVKCQMMNLRFETNYFEDENMQVIEIPYQNKKSSMLVFLPKKNGGFNSRIFNYDYYKKISGQLINQEVRLSFPKFKMAVNYELAEYLKKMGLKSAFEPGADFSGITGNKSLMLDKILHKSVIDVSEKGTEAASSTGVISMRSTKIEKQLVGFIADRPFYFIIKQNAGSLILFMGYLSRPE